jgi:hypothetical protein
MDETDFPDEGPASGRWPETGEFVKPRPSRPNLDDSKKKADERVRDALRRRLIEMIRRNEETRRQKPR